MQDKCNFVDFDTMSVLQINCSISLLYGFAAIDSKKELMYKSVKILQMQKFRVVSKVHNFFHRLKTKFRF